jgi:hypothetical protein
MTVYHVVFPDGSMETVKTRPRAIQRANRGHADHILCTVSLSHPAIRLDWSPVSVRPLAGSFVPADGLSVGD